MNRYYLGFAIITLILIGILEYDFSVYTKYQTVCKNLKIELDDTLNFNMKAFRQFCSETEESNMFQCLQLMQEYHEKEVKSQEEYLKKIGC